MIDAEATPKKDLVEMSKQSENVEKIFCSTKTDVTQAKTHTHTQTSEISKNISC